MRPIGGYFELELHKGDNHYHDSPYVMKSGRSALAYILTLVKPSRVYVPYYTCDALLEPFETTEIPFIFYEIDESLEPRELPELKEGEYFLYVNYMDLKRATVSRLSEKYGDRFIADCTQAFFMRGNGHSWFFNSCRKYFGVPDGAYLFPPTGMELMLPGTRNETYVTEHLLKRFNGHPADGYEFFLQNEVLAGRDMNRISLLSEYLLSHISYTEVMEKRRKNYILLHENLGTINRFGATHPDDNVPMCYPLLLDKKLDKTKLFEQNIFVPAFWKDTLLRDMDGYDVEKRYSEYMLPLPVDHRYEAKDMQYVIRALQEIIDKG